MSYKDALHIVSKEFIAKLIFPDWAMDLTPSMRKIKFAFEELRVRPYNLNILPCLFYFFDVITCRHIWRK